MKKEELSLGYQKVFSWVEVTEFALWISRDAKQVGINSWKWVGDNYQRRYSTYEMLDLFMEHWLALAARPKFEAEPVKDEVSEAEFLDKKRDISDVN